MTRSLLMVEDNADNAELALWILEDADYQVKAVETAELGLEALQTEEFDLVLMDISLPKMDGKEAIKWIREQPKLQQMPVVALTAHAILKERDDIMASGATCIVTKPVDEDLLLQTLEQLLTAGSEH